MYQALYRKWRPKVFEDVSGQPHITQTLKHELEAGRIAHAYLFTGSRGTGKTTCAKILAKAVNCLHPQGGDPCNQCEICRGIDSGSVLDVVEIDAASNNGVDNIRSLREEAGFTPAAAKYRVYIIDEAHMLSQGAFNALLKTLEEPPAYVIFILATTEINKIPATILSRCQRFDFRRIPVEDIAARVRYVAQQEKIEIDTGAAELIARLSDGALRDAISLLDQCAGAGTRIDEHVVSAAAGLTGREYLDEMAAAIQQQDAKTVLQLVDRLYSASKDCERLCEELLEYFRNIMILKTVGNQSFLNLTAGQAEKCGRLAEGFTVSGVLHILDSLQQTIEKIHGTTSKRVEIEMGLLRLCSPALDTSNTALLRRIAALEEKLKSGAFVAGAPKQEAKPAGDPEQSARGIKASRAGGQEAAKLPEKAPGEAEAAAAPAPPEPPEEKPAKMQDEPFSCWPEVLEVLAASDPPLCGVLNGSSAVLRGNIVLVDTENSMFHSLIRQQGHGKALVESVRRATGQSYKVGVLKKNLRPESGDVRDPLDEIIHNASSGGVEIKEE